MVLPGTILRQAAPRPLDERMKPPLARQRLWRNTAEPPELRDHMGLIGIAALGCHLRPIHPIARARIRVCEKTERRLKPRQPAINLRSYPDTVPKHACQMLPRYSRCARQL